MPYAVDSLLLHLQLKDSIDKRSSDIRKLEKRINEIVDRIYKDFSQAVGVKNIREYEENQLKAAQSMAEERFNVSDQLAKLKYQYVFLLSLLFMICRFFFFVNLLWLDNILIL